MKTFIEYINEKKMPPALKKKIEDIESGKMDDQLQDLKKRAEKFGNKQIQKAISDRIVARVEGKDKYKEWAKKFVQAANNIPEFSDPGDIANSAGIDFREYEKNSREIDKEIKKITGKRNLEDFMKSIG